MGKMPAAKLVVNIASRLTGRLFIKLQLRELYKKLNTAMALTVPKIKPIIGNQLALVNTNKSPKHLE